MKLSNSEIFNARVPLEGLLVKDMPIKTAYELAKIGEKINPQLTVIDKIRTSLFQKYGKPDEKNPIKLNIEPSSPDFPKFASEMGILMAQEVDLDITPVALPDTLEVSPATLMALSKFVKVS